MTSDERIAELETENARLRAAYATLREQVARLLERVQVLEARLAKDSHNSSKPPSSDGLTRKTRRLRRRSGKKPGGQLGHRGQMLRLVATPDAVVEHRPTGWACCHAPFDALDDAAVERRERRQVCALPALRLVVQEQRAAPALSPLPDHDGGHMCGGGAEPGPVWATPACAGGVSGGAAVRAVCTAAERASLCCWWWPACGCGGAHRPCAASLVQPSRQWALMYGAGAPAVQRDHLCVPKHVRLHRKSA